MYKSGVPTDVGQFSHDKVGTLVDDYLVNTAKLTSCRWEHLMETCGVSNEELNPPLDTSVMQQDRRNPLLPALIVLLITVPVMTVKCISRSKVLLHYITTSLAEFYFSSTTRFYFYS
jgi:hypothetical protein